MRTKQEEMKVSVNCSSSGDDAFPHVSHLDGGVDLEARFVRGACYGFSTSRWLTEPPRKKRWRTMSWASRNTITINRTRKRNFTIPSQGEFRPAETVMLEFDLI
jgi:hypothetical protein